LSLWRHKRHRLNTQIRLPYSSVIRSKLGLPGRSSWQLAPLDTASLPTPYKKVKTTPTSLATSTHHIACD